MSKQTHIIYWTDNIEQLCSCIFVQTCIVYHLIQEWKVEEPAEEGADTETERRQKQGESDEGK